jgi:hypothetical protein
MAKTAPESIRGTQSHEIDASGVTMAAVRRSDSIEWSAIGGNPKLGCALSVANFDPDVRTGEGPEAVLIGDVVSEENNGRRADLGTDDV